ncbi:MAG: DUF1192 domain-containing protein [Rhodospirillales bacterium]|nr:DUF1192 domain-containing protein [Rhodospirillales bacterium]
MDTDDLEPSVKKPAVKNLEEMSIEALQDYIAEMEGEISRVREAIAAKKEALSGAEGVFKT